MLKRIQEPEAWEPQINQAAFEALDMAIEALSQESSEDVISRQAAIDRATKEHDFFRGAVTVSDKARRDELLNVMCWLGELPPAQPAPSQVAADIARIVENGQDMRVIEAAQPTPDQNGDLWITVPDIDKVTCIYVQESKSKFCRIFYEER